MKRVIAITAALFAAGAVQAQPLESRTVRVSYADLDLSSVAGREALERRVGFAVKRVCPERPSPTEWAKMKIYKGCLDKAWAGVRPQLAAAYDSRHLAQAEIRVGAR